MRTLFTNCYDSYREGYQPSRFGDDSWSVDMTAVSLSASRQAQLQL